MFLNDIGKTPNTRFKKINRYLKENYGIKLASALDDDNINAAFDQIHEEITQLKLAGEVSLTSPEISKRLLVLDGLRSLKESAITKSPVFASVLRNLVDYVVNEVALESTGHEDIRGLLDNAIRNAMSEYRSSKYRFPDDVVERELRTDAKFQLSNNGHTAELDEADDSDVWSHVGKRSGAGGGYSPSVKDAAVTRMGGDLDLSLEPIDAPAELVRDPRTGKMVPNPFSSKINATRGKGYMEENEFGAESKLARHRRERVTNNGKPTLPLGKSVNPRTGEEVIDPFTAHKQKMKGNESMQESENLVKKLRHLLETEVNQAEVMMAAKGFAQELQEMVEKIGRLQNEDLPPVTDQMRQTYGTDSASAFQSQIYAALQGVMDALYTAKSQVDAAVDSMASTGQVGATVDMDVDMSDEIPGDMDTLGAGLADAAPDEDEFGDIDMEEPLGRAQKESVDLQHKVLEMKKLVAKAKKLKESQK